MLSSVEFRAGLQGPFYYILIWMYPSPTNIGTWRITSLLVGPVYNLLGLSCRTFILSWGKEEGPARKKNLDEGVPGPIGVVILPTQTMSLFSGEIPAILTSQQKDCHFSSFRDLDDLRSIKHSRKNGESLGFWLSWNLRQAGAKNTLGCK